MGEQQTHTSDGDSGERYDAVPYTSYPYRESHPRRMHAAARLMGFEAPAPATCRVLELGCAGGGNLVPMGEQLSGGRFVGVDYSAVQVEQARQFASAAGVTNAEFIHASIADLTKDLGEFDYVIAHGVFSWVNRELQDHIFRICREMLAPTGVVYLSFNVMPGWHDRLWTREAMLFHAGRETDPVRKVAAAKEFLQVLASFPGNKQAHAARLNEEIGRLKGRRDDYVLHEYMEDVNDPMYFEEFMRRAGAFGLQYLADGRVNGAPQEEAWGPAKAILDSAGTDVVRREQYLDILRNRSFRRSYLCRDAVKLERSWLERRLEGLWVQPQIVPRGHAADGTVQFAARSGGQYRTARPDVLKFLQRSLQALPGFVRVDEQVGEPVRAELGRMWEANLIELYADPPACATTVGDRPAASRVARHLAAHAAVVTTFMHDAVQLTPQQQSMLAVADGSRERADVARLGGEEMLGHLYRLGLMVA